MLGFCVIGFLFVLTNLLNTCLNSSVLCITSNSLHLPVILFRQFQLHRQALEGSIGHLMLKGERKQTDLLILFNLALHQLCKKIDLD